MDNSSGKPLAVANVFEEALRRAGDWHAWAVAKLEESYKTDPEFEAQRRATTWRTKKTRSVKERKRLKAGILSEFPEGVRNHMLSFLPAQDLCRYRLVCKDWNELFWHG